MVNYAYVKIWGELVGVVIWDENTQSASFEYDANFIRKGRDLSPIKMPIQSTRRIFNFPDLRGNTTFDSLPGLLADSLPDNYGHKLLNAWLAQTGRAVNSMNPVEKLLFIGQRGMGALEFEPPTITPHKRAFDIEMESLVMMAQKMLNSREDFSTNIKDDEKKSMMDILKIGTSAGGARPKAIIAYNEKTGQIKSGQTKSPKGFKQWLIKLDGISDAQLGDSKGYGRVEMAYYLMAKDAGIEMNECRLLEENDRAHFMTLRFDRDENNTKHHIQTFCAMQHFDYNEVRSYSYEQLFQTMRLLRLPYPQAEQMYRRMAFNVLARNCDDHTKNFAFRLKQDQHWEISPAYDICHSYKPDSQWVNQHSLSVNGKRNNITKHDLLSLAKSMNIKKAAHIIDEISNVVKRWPEYADECKLDPTVRDAKGATLLSL